MPKNHREDEEALDASDVRKILLSCNNRRVKAFLLVLASGGMRTGEALAIRIKDIDFSVSPTKVHIRKEFAKTRVGRDVYISDESTKFVKDWIDWKYRTRKYYVIRGIKQKEWTPVMRQDDLLFTKTKFGETKTQQDNEDENPDNLYLQLLRQFNSILNTVGMDELKDGMIRRRVTLHSLRRLVKTVISNQVSQDYSEWFLGHSKSSYWTMKEAQRRDIYATKCMKYLTFLDFSGLEATEKNIESKLEAKDREIAYLRHRDMIKEDLMASLSDRVLELTTKVDNLMKNQNRDIQ